MIKLIAVTAAIALLAAPARAQISPFGGAVPFLNPYPIYAPNHPPDAAPDANQDNSAHCGPTYAGRGGVHYPCGENQGETRR